MLFVGAVATSKAMVAKYPQIAFTGNRVFRRGDFFIGLIEILVTGVPGNQITNLVLIPADNIEIKVQINGVFKVGQFARQFFLIPF